MLVAVTRPEADGARTAAALRARGHEVLLAPLMRVEPVAADLAGDWTAIAITSANALSALGGRAEPLKHLPVFAVGGRSAAAAQGFAQVHAADGDVAALARLIARVHRGGRVLYLAGEDRSAGLVASLAQQGVAAALRVVYRAVTAPYPPALAAALQAGTVGAVLHYSRRSAQTYVAGAREAGLERHALAPRQLCLSGQVAEPLIAAGSRVEIATRPDETALLAML
jgi:uroporphyrinogen-III synthase